MTLSSQGPELVRVLGTVPSGGRGEVGPFGEGLEHHGELY